MESANLAGEKEQAAAMVYAIPHKARAKLVQLGKEIRTVADFWRKCICTGRGYYTLEDWISFMETFSDLLLRHEDILHPEVRLCRWLNRSAMWKC